MDFRIAICLTKYFNDERSFCYVHLGKDYKVVADLQIKIRNLFDLQGDFCLMSNNHLLPNEESIKIIESGETITAIPIKESWNAIFSNDNEKKSCENVEDELIQKCNEISLSPVYEKHKKKKKKKKSESYDFEEINMSPGKSLKIFRKEKKNSKLDEVDKKDNSFENDKKDDSFEDDKKDESFEDDKKDDCFENNKKDDPFDDKKDETMDVSILSEISKDKKEINDSQNSEKTAHDYHTDISDGSDMENVSIREKMQTTLQILKNRALSFLDSNQKVVSGVSAGRINKKKRLRKRKNKTNSFINTNTAQPDIKDSKPTLPAFTNTNKSLSHIRFTDDEKPIIIRNGGMNVLSDKPRIVYAIESGTIAENIPCSDNKTTFEIEHTQCTDQSKQEEVTEILNKNIADSNITLKIDSLLNNLREYPIMNDLFPKENDVILFKMLKMENYAPIVSKYILGIVTSISEPNTVKISIIDGHNECREPKGKFDLDLEDNDESLSELILEMEWSQIIEPRIIFP